MNQRSTSLSNRWNILALLSFFLLLSLASGCTIDGRFPGEQQDTLSTKSQKLHNFPTAVARSLSGFDNLPHGIAGDRHLVFVTEPLNARVVVTSRFTGRHLAIIPAPPGGFLLPFTMRIKGPGRLAILDSGGFPSPTTPVIPRIYEYTYSWNHRTKTFSATLVRNVLLNTVPFVFSEDFTIGPDGTYYITDSILGTIWMLKPDNSVLPGIIPSSFAPQDAIPQLSGCLFPNGVKVDNIPFQTAGNFAPGVGAITNNQTHLFFGSSCQGGVFKVPLSVFSDNRAPHLRAADISVVSAKPAGLLAESLKGLSFNTYNPHDNKLYATDTLQLQVIRIDLQTGAREVIKQDPKLFNFSVAAQFLPPLFPGAPAVMVVSSDQEHRLASLNVAITEDLFQSPFLITKVLIFR